MPILALLLAINCLPSYETIGHLTYLIILYIGFKVGNRDDLPNECVYFEIERFVWDSFIVRKCY